MSNFDSQIEYTPVEKSSSTSESVQRTDVLKVGAGSNRFEVNLKEGLFLGANTFLDAPARIGFDGSALFSSVVITNDAGDIIIDEYGTKMIADAVITTAAIADGAVDTEKLAALAVEAANLADSAVTTTKIANLAVGSAAIQALAVGTAHIANSAIINAKIGNAAITDAKIANATITAAKISTINADTITAGTITGRTVNANGGSGTDIELNNAGVLYFKYGGSSKGSLYVTPGGDVFLSSTDDMFFGSSGTMLLSASSNITIAGDDVTIGYDDDDDGSDMFFVAEGASQLTAKLSTGGNLDIHGTLDENQFDYAEMFENAEKGVIPYGTSVVIHNESGKVRPAKEGEIPFGVVSATPGIIGNNGTDDAGTSWGGKYLRDEDYQYVMKEVEKVRFWVRRDKFSKKADVRKIQYADELLPKGAVDVQKYKKMEKIINPNYDDTKKFVKRSDRKEEWSVIGMLGQVLTLKDQTTDPRWIKAKEFNSKYDLYIVR